MPFSQEYFLCQVYALPVSVCLAHSNSCLKPILYCLVRREFRNALENLLRRLASPSLTGMRPFAAATKPEPEDQAGRPWRLSTRPRSPTGSTLRPAWWSTARGATTCCPAAPPTDAG